MIKFIALALSFLWLFNLQADAADFVATPSFQHFKHLTIDTMSPELSTQVMSYVSLGKDKKFTNRLLRNSSHQTTVPIVWEVFIIKQILDRNMSVVYGLDKIYGSNLYNYLSIKYDTVFIKSNLLFSFVLNMGNWSPKTVSIFLRDSNYGQIEETLMKAVKLIALHCGTDMVTETLAEKIGFFMAYSATNLSSPWLVIMDLSLQAAAGAPQKNMWNSASAGKFYQALDSIVQAEATLQGKFPHNSYSLAQRNAMEVTSKGQEKLKAMAADTVLKTVAQLDAHYDRAEAAYKLTNLFILASMVKYVYIRAYMNDAAAAATKVVTKMTHTDQEQVFQGIVEQLKELPSQHAQNYLISPLMQKLVITNAH